MRRLLISGLERDGRMSYADLAALAGLSAAATRSRVLRLIRGGAVHVTVLVDAAHTGRLARAGLGITVHGPAQAIAEQVAGLPDVTYVLTGTGRFDLIAAADTSSETSLLRTVENIRALHGVNRVQSWRHLQIVKESYPRMTQLEHRLSPAAPPPRFSGGGKWEAMHGTMGGWYEIRLTGPGREQLWLFCLPENGTSDELARRGLPRPAIAVITGMRKPWRTVFSERDYQRVRELGREHQQNYPRRIAT